MVQDCKYKLFRSFFFNFLFCSFSLYLSLFLSLSLSLSLSLTIRKGNKWIKASISRYTRDAPVQTFDIKPKPCLQSVTGNINAHSSRPYLDLHPTRDHKWGAACVWLRCRWICSPAWLYNFPKSSVCTAQCERVLYLNSPTKKCCLYFAFVRACPHSFCLQTKQSLPPSATLSSHPTTRTVWFLTFVTAQATALVGLWLWSWFPFRSLCLPCCVSGAKNI